MQKNRHISMENKVQYQALVKLGCYITAECQTEPEENGQSMWSAESPKAPRLTTVPTPGQFSVRKKEVRRLIVWDKQMFDNIVPQKKWDSYQKHSRTIVAQSDPSSGIVATFSVVEIQE